jgi:hypothetical protein
VWKRTWQGQPKLTGIFGNENVNASPPCRADNAKRRDPQERDVEALSDVQLPAAAAVAFTRSLA